MAGRFVRRLCFAYWLTDCLSPLPALNFGCREAGIMMASPVRGLRPRDAARLATLNVPKPTSRTSPPPVSSPVMLSKIASTALAASALERPEPPATAATRSFLFTVRTPLQNRDRVALNRNQCPLKHGGVYRDFLARVNARTAEIRAFFCLSADFRLQPAICRVSNGGLSGSSPCRCRPRRRPRALFLHPRPRDPTRSE